MSDAKKRIKAIESKLDIGQADKVIIIRPPKYPDETEAEYLARMDEPDPPGYIRKVTHYGNITVTGPAYLPEGEQ